MTVRRLDVVSSGLLAASLWLTAATADRVHPIEYADLPEPLRQMFVAQGLSASAFGEYIQRIEAETGRRVAEGEREHLIHYALQSTRFTDRPPIEPALSARRFVERLSDDERAHLLRDPSYRPRAGWLPAERARVADLLGALRKESADARLAYFRTLLPWNEPRAAIDGLYADYVRVAIFLYRKEFLASSGSGNDVTQIAALYESRPHSSDTQIEAGYGVYLGLGALHALDPALHVRKALVVGPGLDLAPRTDLIDAVDPQSYQPLAVADALIALSLASEGDLRVHSIDVNPRVVRALEASARGPLTVHLFTGIAETPNQPFRPEYRAYVRDLGRAIGNETEAPERARADRRYHHSITVRPPVARAMTAERLNIVTERLVDEPSFDVAVATNVLAYFDDRQLALALANIASMLRPGGYLLHNESRPGLTETAARLGLPLIHTRTAILGGSPARRLYDIIWLHQKPKT